MATLVYSALVDGNSYAFNPAVDVLQVNGGLSAAQLALSGSGSVIITAGGKTVTLLTTLATLTTTNVAFNDLSALLVGDNTTATVNDDQENFRTGGINNDRLIGLGGNDTLNGQAGGDALVGGAGNDLLDGGTGDDSMSGGTGNDTYVVDTLLDVVSEAGGGGVDLVESSLTWKLVAGLENLTLTGAAIKGTGNGAANLITGNSGANTLLGGAGSDTLDGGAGIDSLNGGAGKDVLAYDAADTKANGGGGNIDTLQVSGAGVTLDLTAIANTVLLGFERIDVTGTGGNTLVLSAADLAALSGTSDTLLVKGNAGDAVQATGTWTQLANTAGGSAQYTNGTVTLQVDLAIDRSGIAVAGLSLAALDGKNGLRLDGVAASDLSGSQVASAGDVNGDGYDDLIVGARLADPGGDSVAGSSYVVFGKASGFGASLDLAALNGATGFRVDGANPYDSSGISVASAGDVNSDGFDDLLVGAQNVGTVGATYVLFGKSSGFASALDLGTINGANGFRLDGSSAFDASGRSVASAGDVNGDGFSDVIVGAWGGDPGGDSYAGQSYVVFGKASGFGSALALGALNGANGFRLDGVDAYDNSGQSVAGAGDVNGDGFADIIVGAAGGDPGGESYVVFGKATGFASALGLGALNGSNGFRLDGAANDYSGISVASAGDVNGDGFGDLIVGADAADPGGDANAGETYVVFGKASGFASALSLSTLNGTNGFRLDGIDASDSSGQSVASAGDMNGDGFDDLVVGAFAADPGGNSNAGESYVVFGKASGFGATLDLGTLSGASGFRFDGIDAGDFSGFSVASAGDLNGDGFGDLVIGASQADAGGDADAGETYVVFGFDNGAVDFLGGGLNNLLTGGAAAEAFVGGLGNDTLVGGGGADAFKGGRGNDRVVVADTDFFRVDGGSGKDTLALAGGGRTLDFGALDANAVRGTEVVDLTGSGNNALAIDALQLLSLSDTSNRLTVEGNAGDSVDSDDLWEDGGAVAGYHLYTLGEAELLIDADVTVLFGLI